MTILLILKLMQTIPLHEFIVSIFLLLVLTLKFNNTLSIFIITFRHIKICLELLPLSLSYWFRCKEGREPNHIKIRILSWSAQSIETGRPKLGNISTLNTGVLAGLALYWWWQRLITFESSKIRVKTYKWIMLTYTRRYILYR